MPARCLTSNIRFYMFFTLNRRITLACWFDDNVSGGMQNEGLDEYSSNLFYLIFQFFRSKIFAVGQIENCFGKCWISTIKIYRIPFFKCISQFPLIYHLFIYFQLNWKFRWMGGKLLKKRKIIYDIL